jgi:cyclophilin family peptidyl-prolyl cis-trans isomerase
MSTRKQRKQPAAPPRNPLLIPGIIAAAGLLFFAAGAVFSRQPQRGPRTLSYSAPPPFTIDPSRAYVATIKTAKGDIVIELLPDAAPVTVNNFVFLAREGFYDGVTFHRVLPGFMAQGGDPTGTGGGGPGYQFQDEISSLQFDGPGLLAMANGGPNTNGSQFFITYAPTPHLNGYHTIFGRVIRGMDVAQALTPRDPDQNPAEPGDVIQTILIDEI